MTKLNRNTKTQVAEAIQQLYIVSTAINLAVGNEIHQDYFENQCNLTLSEINETEEAIKNGDLVEVLDGIGDMIVTGSFVNIIIDGNDDLTKNAPLYLNESGTSLEELFSSAKVSFNSGHYIDFLESVEDMAYQVNGDFVEYASAINKSNLSKFPEVGTIDPEVEADLIEQQGRYPDVYFEETDLLGKRVYVFKSKYDATNDESFPKGKYLKPPTVFKEPQDFL